jgi:hypothetical protein
MFVSKENKVMSNHVSTYKYGDKVTKKFLNELIDILRQSKFESYTFECKKYKEGEYFSFNLHKSNLLEKRTEADLDTFDEHFNNNKYENVIFENLGKDCLLICPNYKVLDFNKSRKKNIDYTNISRYFRTQSKAKLIDLLQLVFNNYKEDMYLSAHGLGVNYLHFRLEYKPKYYHNKFTS